MSKEIIIHIYPASEGGYMYDLYKNQEALEEQNVIDGGQVDSEDINETLKMATEEAKSFLGLDEYLETPLPLNEWETQMIEDLSVTTVEMHKDEQEEMRSKLRYAFSEHKRLILEEHEK